MVSFWVFGFGLVLILFGTFGPILWNDGSCGQQEDLVQLQYNGPRPDVVCCVIYGPVTGKTIFDWLLKKKQISCCGDQGFFSRTGKHSLIDPPFVALNTIRNSLFSSFIVGNLAES